MARKTAFGKDSNYQTFVLLGQKIGRDRDSKALIAQINYLKGSDLVAYQRAASVLHHVSNEAPELFLPHIATLMDIAREHKHDAGLRVAMRVLMFLKIPEKFTGTLIDFSFSIINNPKMAVAIKVYAMNIIATQAKIYPELTRELAISISSQIRHQSPAFHACVRKLSKVLKTDLKSIPS